MTQTKLGSERVKCTYHLLNMKKNKQTNKQTNKQKTEEERNWVEEYSIFLSKYIKLNHNRIYKKVANHGDTLSICKLS